LVAAANRVDPARDRAGILGLHRPLLSAQAVGTGRGAIPRREIADFDIPGNISDRGTSIEPFGVIPVQGTHGVLCRRGPDAGSPRGTITADAEHPHGAGPRGTGPSPRRDGGRAAESSRTGSTPGAAGAPRGRCAAPQRAASGKDSLDRKERGSVSSTGP